MDPAAEATILCADVRPYRESAAAASDEDGRGVGHERGYKAGRFHGQAKIPCPSQPVGDPGPYICGTLTQIGAKFLLQQITSAGRHHRWLCISFREEPRLAVPL